MLIGLCQGRVSFGQRVVNLEGAQHRSHGFWQGLARGSASILFQQRVAVGESDVSKRVVRVLVRRLLEMFNRSLQSFRGSLVPVISPLQIKLVRIRVSCISPNELLLLCTS